MIERIRAVLTAVLGVALSVFTVYEVNYGLLPPLSQLAVFAMLGITLCFIMYPLHARWKDSTALRVVDLLLCVAVAVCCGYLIWQGQSLSDRPGAYTRGDVVIAMMGTVLVLEATRRSIGWALPILAGGFVLYGYVGASLPDWAFPHRGYDLGRIAEQCFLRTEGVFGVAMGVMFTYVFLFVIFGAFLEISGATQFIIDFAGRLFGGFSGGPAMVSVAGAGLMGSLSGSAVANAVTTGTFTIPMMRSAGFRPHIAGGVTAAAASGGALMPPVMGAGAYMMLEIIEPPVTFLQIMKAAILPALLYYMSLLLIVYFYSQRAGAQRAEQPEAKPSLLQFSGIVFIAALGALIAFLLLGYTPFRAVTYSLEVILVLSILNPRIQVGIASRVMALGLLGLVTLAIGLYRSRQSEDLLLTDWSVWADAAIPGMLLVLLLGLLHSDWRKLIQEAFTKSARGGISLVSASGCVGIIIGVVGLTGIGTAFPNAVVPLAEESLLLALAAIMICSIVLGMGLPSAVCYLLMATLIGPVLNRMGVIPLAAHLFIFYFGMMSMVTPPVALAAYASAGIADSKIMQTSLAAFRFALAGFTLPYMFVYRPALLLMTPQGDALSASDLPAVVLAIGAAVVGIIALAAGIAGYFRTRLSMSLRAVMLISAALLLLPEIRLGQRDIGLYVNLAGGALFAVMAVWNWRSAKPAATSL
jgi:TRAP transporter 4TM/12TM fusion protein